MNIQNPLLYVISLGLVTALSACQSNIPEQIRQGIESSPSVAQVREAPQKYVSQSIRWGGLILETENRQDTSRLTVMALPLSDKGKPRIYDQSPGRFIAVINKFVEPLEFSRDRQITFSGIISGAEKIKVGDFPYEYPVIQVDQYHLWPKPVPTVDPYYPDYWRYDPWYYPGFSPWYYPYRHYPIRLVPHPR